MAAASVTLLRRVEVSDKDPFCPEIPHFIFKPGNWLLISILNTSCPGAGWWQQTAKFRSCLRSVNWVIHGLKNGIKHLKKKNLANWRFRWYTMKTGLTVSQTGGRWCQENKRQETTDNVTQWYGFMWYSSMTTKQNSFSTPSPWMKWSNWHSTSSPTKRPEDAEGLAPVTKQQQNQFIPFCFPFDLITF